LSDASLVKLLLTQIKSGDREAAAASINELTSSSFDIGDLWITAARAAVTIGELTLAEICADKFLQIDTLDTQRALHTAGLLADAGRFDMALELIEPRLQQRPDDPSLNHLCGTVYQQLGQRQRAEQHLLCTLKTAALAGMTWLTLAAQHKFDDGDPLLRRLMSLKSAFSDTDPTNRMHYQYAVGKALLDRGDYEEAFDAFALGASLAPGATHYDPAKERRAIEAIIATNDKRTLAATARINSVGDRNVFVIGPPRSGTTLLQRILTAHRDVAGGGEFSGIGVATMNLRREGLCSAAALSQFDDAGAGKLEDVGRSYTHLAIERFGVPHNIVDKSINNARFVGMIAKVFPEAPIIVLERDINDVAWSCFRTCFSQGQHWSWSLENIASHLKAELRLIDHWRDVLPGRLIDVRYENLVNNPEQELPALLRACGLPADDQVINFHRQEGAVTTASVAQVDQPLNTRSVGAAVHVAHRMQPFVDAFKD
jgi:thioredoxin-like negative regulator of GroEL